MQLLILPLSSLSFPSLSGLNIRGNYSSDISKRYTSPRINIRVWRPQWTTHKIISLFLAIMNTYAAVCTKVLGPTHQITRRHIPEYCDRVPVATCNTHYTFGSPYAAYMRSVRQAGSEPWPGSRWPNVRASRE